MEIYEDLIHRIAYSVDASVYREMPMGVAYPASTADIVELVHRAHEGGFCLIPRAGGTSIAGQVVGNGMVVDVSRYMNKILEVNVAERWVRVEPGVVRDELNMALREYGLFFSPETSTSNRCCIGGMVGNNSCGTHSLVYGSTRHHVLQLKGVLADGSLFDTDTCGDGELEKKIRRQLELWRDDEEVRRLIEENFPDGSLRRRSCGYAIDEALGLTMSAVGTESHANDYGTDVSSGEAIDLCKLICGSEGTLCFVTEVKLGLDSLPPKEKMVLCAHCGSLEDSFEANLVALRHSPVAVELMDGKILELSKGNIAANRNRFFVDGNPAALLIAEFNGAEMDRLADEAETELLKSGLAYACTRVYGDDVSRVWALRKAGLGILSGMKGDAKPVGVIEDTAVAPERMPAYMRDFREMLGRLGIDSCVFYGHISTGELHLRPVINLKTREGRRQFRQVAEETAVLVRRHRGSLSGEHGDGRLRGEFIPLMYGEECYELMREVKKCWDPYGVFNMNKIVDTPRMDEGMRPSVPAVRRVKAGEGSAGSDETRDGTSGEKTVVGRSEERGREEEYVVEKDGGLVTGFNWRTEFDECKVSGASGVRNQTHALMASIEQCNGAGECRKSNKTGGTICPAFKVSMDELNSTRARANILRELLTYGLQGSAEGKPDALRLREVKAVLDSCLACKGCRNECPSSVDMAKIRAEVLYQIHKAKGTDLRSWAVARMAEIERLGRIVRPLYNFAAGWRPSAWVVKKVVGFSSKRDLPLLSSRNGVLMDITSGVSRHGYEKVRADAEEGRRRRKVYFFLDEFTESHEWMLGVRFVELLEGLGYEVAIPRHVESGRAAISKGCLSLARKRAVRNVELLRDIVSEECPLVGIEPSCILSFRDEYPDLVPQELRLAARRLGECCLLYDEFLLREIHSGGISAESFSKTTLDIWLHGHCHQKALVGVEKTAEVLRTLLSGSEVHVIPSGCCGMAGSFGYEKEHYETSMAIGEMVLFPAVRKALGIESGPKSGMTNGEAAREGKTTVVLAPGTSCRQQILDGTGVKALHPVELLRMMAVFDG